MTPELQKQVEVEAKDKYPANSTIYLDMRSGYIAAATPYAEKVEQLEQEVARLKALCLKQYDDMIDDLKKRGVSDDAIKPFRELFIITNNL